MIEQNTKLVDLERLAQYKALSDKLYAKRSSVETEVEHIIINGHEAIDLGIVLPNGNHLLWAACNVGATTPEESGDYYQWGSTTPNTDTPCDWAHAPFNNGSSTYDSTYFESVKDTVCPDGVLASQYDAASVNMGGKWRMPTKADFQKLLANTNNEWIEDYNSSGVNGRKFTSKTDNSRCIFISTSGLRDGSYSSSKRSYCDIMSSSLTDTNYVFVFNFSSDFCQITTFDRYYGLSVRGVIELTDEELNNIKYPSKFYTKSETDAKIQTLAESLATADIKDDDVTEADVTAVLCPTEEGYSPWG